MSDVRLLGSFILAPAQTSSCNKPKAGKSFAVGDAGEAEAGDGDDAGGAAQAGGGSGHHLLGVDG